MDILLISPMRLLRDALVATLQGADGHRASGAFSLETIETAIAGFLPNMVVVDGSHSEATALVAAVRVHVPTAHVVVLAMRDRDEDFLAWADIGISGYLGPDTSANDLLSAVRRVGAGEVACPRRLTALLLNRFAGRSTEQRVARAGIASLTIREREIAGLLADGLSNKLIARQLDCALATVKNHVHSILDKWECQSRGEAAARYRQKILGDAEPNGGGTLVELRPGSMALPNGAAARNNGMQHRTSAVFNQKAA